VNAPAAEYLNPVYRRSCPDPFVLKYDGEYWCYFTGIQPDGRCFGLLHSRDLVYWQAVGSVMDPLPGNFPCYWAPEVVYANGLFYLYYSVGNEEQMEIRVALADRPDGLFVDQGKRLTREPFAIDAHVFIDDDGRRYMFYATDFLDHTRIGTGTVCDRLLDPFTLAGSPRPVTRALFDWQVYDPQRQEKGGVRWHTIEGPFVLKHGGRYYQMFSGGNWQNASYGVSYATSDRIESQDEWQQASDGEGSLPVLRSLPEQGVIGPGHNSVVRGLDNQELFCVYHRWQPETAERVLAIDRLDWVGDRLVVLGPSYTPQPMPETPLIAGFEAFTPLSGGWRLEQNASAVWLSGEDALASLFFDCPACVIEINFLLTGQQAPDRFGFGLAASDRTQFEVSLHPETGRLHLKTLSGEQQRELPPDFAAQAVHLLRLEVQDRWVKIFLDDVTVRTSAQIVQTPDALILFNNGAPVRFSGFALARKQGISG
jgi:GH43 family beta-xylosidase